MEWLLFLVSCFLLFLFLSAVSLPLSQLTRALEGLISGSGPMLLLRKEKRGKGVTPIPALAPAEGSELFPEQNEMKAPPFHSPHTERGALYSLSVFGGMPSSQRSSYPTHAKDRLPGGNSFILQILLNTLLPATSGIEQTLYPPTWNLKTRRNQVITKINDKLWPWCMLLGRAMCMWPLKGDLDSKQRRLPCKATKALSYLREGEQEECSRQRAIVCQGPMIARSMAGLFEWTVEIWSGSSRKSGGLRMTKASRYWVLTVSRTLWQVFCCFF